MPKTTHALRHRIASQAVPPAVDAAVGVLTGFRRRGIASALSAHLARTAHSQSISLVFLEAEPEEEQIYRRTGFTDATAKLWASIR